MLHSSPWYCYFSNPHYWHDCQLHVLASSFASPMGQQQTLLWADHCGKGESENRKKTSDHCVISSKCIGPCSAGVVIRRTILTLNKKTAGRRVWISSIEPVVRKNTMADPHFWRGQHVLQNSERVHHPLCCMLPLKLCLIDCLISDLGVHRLNFLSFFSSARCGQL